MLPPCCMSMLECLSCTRTHAHEWEFVQTLSFLTMHALRVLCCDCVPSRDGAVHSVRMHACHDLGAVRRGSTMRVSRRGGDVSRVACNLAERHGTKSGAEVSVRMHPHGTDLFTLPAFQALIAQTWS